MSSLPLAIIRIGIDPVVHIGPFPIHWYGVMYAVAFYVGYRVAVVPYLTRHGIDRPTIDRLVTWTIIMGLIGARLYYVAQSGLGDYLRHPQDILAFWKGGMAFFGAILAGFATLAVLGRRYHLSFWVLADSAVLFAVVGQPIGRIGNLINGDILGGRSTLPWATAYTNPSAVLQDRRIYDFCDPSPNSLYCPAYQPAAAYEAIGTILIGLVLLWLLRRRVRDGVLTITYVALYAVSQIVIFRWRETEPVLALGLKQAQLTAIVVLAVGVPGLLLLRRRSRIGDPPEVRRGEPVTEPAQPAEPVG